MKEKRFLVLALSCLFILSFSLNSIGITFGLPHYVDWDEAYITVPAFDLLKQGALKIDSFGYPCLYMYVTAFVFILVFFFIVITGRWNIPDPVVQAICRATWSDFYIGGRLFTALLGAVAVILTYVVGKRCFSKRAALIGAGCLAVSPLFVEQSHLIHPNIPSVLLVVIAAHYSLKILETDVAHAIFLAGLFSGLAASAKYNGGFIVVSGITAIILSRKYQKWMLSWCILFIGFLLGLFTTSYKILTDIPRFLNSLGLLFGFYRFRGSISSETPDSITTYIRTFSTWGLGIIALIFAGCGFILSLRDKDAKTKRACLVIGVFSFLYFVCISLARMHRYRHILPIVPFFALFCGYAIDLLMTFISKVARKKERKNSKYGVSSLNLLLLIAVFCVPLKHDWDFDRDLLKPDSRNIAWDWIKNNIPFQSKILLQTADPRDFEKGGYVDTVPVVPGFFIVKNIVPGKPLFLLDIAGHDYLVTLTREAYSSQIIQNSEIYSVLELLKEWQAQNFRDPTIRLWRIKKFDLDVVKMLEGKELTYTDQRVREWVKDKEFGLFVSNDKEGYFTVFLKPGEYRLYVRARAQRFQAIFPIMRVKLNDVKIADEVIGSEDWKYYRIDFRIENEGDNKISLSLINDLYIEGVGDVNFYVEYLLLAKK